MENPFKTSKLSKHLNMSLKIDKVIENGHNRNVVENFLYSKHRNIYDFNHSKIVNMSLLYAPFSVMWFCCLMYCP